MANLLRACSEGVRSRARNFELTTLVAPIGFVLLGWLALERSPWGPPDATPRIVAQFALSVFVGHLAVRVLAPQAPPLYAIATMLSAVGLVFVMRLAAASAAAQANWVAVGTASMVIGIVAGRRTALLRRWTYTSGVLALATLAATALFGETVQGARLWLRILGQTVQATELIKAFLILFLAGYVSREAGVLAGGGTQRWRYLIPLAVLWAGALGALVSLRDLGTLAILAALAAAVLALATGRVSYLVGGAVLLAATGVLGYISMEHVQARVDSWLHPYRDPLGRGFQTVQAEFAVANGGLFGTGLGWGMPHLIPAAATDYVFVAVAEELGLFGAAAVSLMFLALVIGGLQVAIASRDAYARSLAAATTVLIGLQAAVILAGNLRLVPTTGVTLPFVSYGGSSLVVNYALIGLLLGIAESNGRN